MNLPTSLFAGARQQLCLVASSLFLTWTFPASGHEPIVTKLHPRPQNPGFNAAGRAVSVSDRFVLLGEPNNSDRGQWVGVTNVYNARNGRFLRLLQAEDGDTFDFFGVSTSICGPLGVVGATSGDGAQANSGAVYGFDLRNGRQAFKLIADDGLVGDGFGRSVSISGNLLLVGAPDHDTTGAAYVFDLHTGQQIAKLISPDGPSADDFGYSVSLSGTLALVGAPNRSAAYVYDVESETLVRKLTASDGTNSDDLGWSVSLQGGTAIVGAPEHNSGRGAVYVFDPAVSGSEIGKLTDPEGEADDNLGYGVSHQGNLVLAGAYHANPLGGNSGLALLFDAATETVVRRLTASDGSAGDQFGRSVALYQNQAVIGADSDDDLGGGTGAAYYFRPVSGPFPLTTLAKTRDFAPGTVDADFRTFLDSVISPVGETAFCGHLFGPGAGRGTAAKGLWSGSGAGVDLVGRGGTEILGGAMVNRISNPLFNRPSFLLFEGTLKGPGVDRNNDAVICSYDLTVVRDVMREDQTDAKFDGARLDQFLDVAQSHTDDLADFATMFRYKNQPGRVNRASDTGVLMADSDGTIREVFQEGYPVDSIGGGTTWGQFAPRVTKTMDTSVFVASLSGIGVTSGLDSVLCDFTPGDVNETILARVGDELGVSVNNYYQRFLGETSTISGRCFHRALLSGPSVNRSNNDALIVDGFALARKGNAINFLQPQVKLHRFLKFWGASNSRFFYLAKLRGPGVSGRNDCVLIMHDTINLTSRILMREGQPISGSDGVTVRSILRVDVNPTTGAYVVLASLTGSPNSNLGLFTGQTIAGDNNTQFALRKPALKLRKGMQFQAPSGESTRIRSLILTNTCDRYGAGGNGGPQVVGEEGEVIACVLFTNRAKELVSGKP